MAEEKQWQRDAFAFANDLYFFLFTKRRMAPFLPSSIKGYSEKSRYTEEIGKAILYLWHSFRDCHRLQLNNSHPEIAENGREFFEYLDSVCPGQEQHEGENIFLIISDMSALLFEICLYLVERNRTSFFTLIPTGWSRIFGLYYKDRFFASGGWEKLKQESMNCATQYDRTAMLFPKNYLFTRKDIEDIFHDKLPKAATELLPEMSGLALQIPANFRQIQPELNRGQLECEDRVPPLHPGLELNIIPPAESKTTIVEQSEVSSSETSEDSCDEYEDRVHPFHPDIVFEKFSVNRSEDNNARRRLFSSFKAIEKKSEQYKSKVPVLHPGIEFDNLTVTGSEDIGGARRKIGHKYTVRKETSDHDEVRKPPFHPGLELKASACKSENLSELYVKNLDQNLTGTSETSAAGDMESSAKISPYLVSDGDLPSDAMPLHGQFTKIKDFGTKNIIPDHSLPAVSTLSINETQTQIPKESVQDSTGSKVKDQPTSEISKKSKKHRKKSKQ